MSGYGHARTLHADYPSYEARRGRELRAEGEAAICDEVGHEIRPAAGGRLACVCCGVEPHDGVRRIGQIKNSPEEGR